MTMENILEAIPEYAKDLKLNLSSLLRQTELTEQQTWGTAVASALASRNKVLYDSIVEEGKKHLSPEALQAAKGAAAIMGMNNIYYRFLHLAEHEKYGTIPARLRMNIMRTHGVDHNDFELWSLAVSAVNGCGKCITSHEGILRQRGIGEETIAAAVRLAAVIHAIASVFDVEAVGAAALDAAVV